METISRSYSKVLADENLMELIDHGTNKYPFDYFYDDLALFDFNCIEWHWHTELEFVYVESGTVTFWIGEKYFALSEGNGVFINSKILHRFHSSDGAVIPNFLCMPSFISPEGSLIYSKYIQPVISSSFAFQVFHKEVFWQAKVLEIMKKIISVQNQETIRELATSALMQEIWLNLWEHVAIKNTDTYSYFSVSSQARLQLMMQYIHQNYRSNISLDNIADYAVLSKSTVLNYFRKYLHTTPINYLIAYRLNEAAVLLRKTEKKIVTVSNETGFSNVDYFCKIFKKHYHLTPTEYRKNKDYIVNTASPYVMDQ